MYKFLWFFYLGLLTSCELFISTEEKTQQLVREELKTINWNEVDQYPLFEVCDETAAKPLQRQCFQEAMLRHCAQAVEELDFRANHELNDTVYLDFIIDEHGLIAMVAVEQKTTVLREIADFNTKISESMNRLTTVAPALKRGIPVRMRFRLPLVLNTE